MKKKIKDLTLEECKKYCQSRKHCDNCFLDDLVKCINLFKRTDLEREIEVDE